MIGETQIGRRRKRAKSIDTQEPVSFDDAVRRLRQPFAGVGSSGAGSPPQAPPPSGTPPRRNGPSVGRIVVAPDAAGLGVYTTALARAPLQELGATAAARVSDLIGQRRVEEIRFAGQVATQSRQADFLASLVERSRARAQASPPANQNQAQARAAIPDASQEIDRFAREMTWDVTVEGDHYSGLTNEELREILAGQDRDFFQDTPALRAHVKARLRDVFSRGAWNDQQAADVSADAIREWIVKRIEEQGVDVYLEPLPSKYRDEKIRDGYDRRIGIRTKAWLGSVKHASVEVRA